MLNISITPLVKSAPSNSGTPEISAAAPASQSENEEFSNVLAREISDKTSDKTSDNKQNTTTISNEESFSQPNTKEDAQQAPENSATMFPGVLPETTFLQPIRSELISNIDLNPVDEAKPLFSLMTMPVSTFPELADSITGNQKQTPTVPLLAFNPTTQRLSMQSSSYPGSWQSFNAANSAAPDRTLPAFTETTTNTLLPGIEESTKLPLSGSMQNSGLNSLNPLALPTMSTVFVPQDINLEVQVGQPKWGGEFAQKIVWLASQQHQLAEIRLNPAHLGPVEVMIDITSEQATAQFVSPHAAAREAIEAALPKLREMMAENGIALGDVTVGADSFRQHADTDQRENKSARYSTNTAKADNGTIVQTEALPVPSNRHNGVVNTFA